MSLILEALKKSEAQRRLGQAPGLLSPALPLAAPRSSRLPWAVALVLALLLVLAGGWWWFAPWAGAPVGTAPAPEPVVSVAGAPAAAEASTERARATADRRAAPALPPAPSQAKARVEPARDAPVRRAALPQDPEFRSVERESGALPADAAPPLDAAPTPRRTAAPALPQPAPVAAAQDPAAPPQATGAAREQTPIASAAEPAPVDAGPDLPALRDLPAGERAALPPLKLSMHVYAEVPAERFVLIDGRRYGEGMAIAPDLLLHEVRRDGVVLEFRGRRFLLQRPG